MKNLELGGLILEVGGRATNFLGFLGEGSLSFHGLKREGERERMEGMMKK